MVAGRTDSGKSTILRALQWLATNQPNGLAFIRKGAKFAKVKLVVDGHTIVRERSKTINRYTLDGKEFRALGNGNVPEEIATLLNVGDINFQGQLDQLYLMTAAPGQVARELNSVVNLGAIDKTLSNIAADARKAKAEEELTGKRLKEAESKLKELSWVPKLDDKLKDVETKQRSLDDLQGKTTRLRELLQEIRQAEAKVKVSVPDTTKMDTLYTSLQKTRTKANGLRSLLSQITSAKQRVKETRQLAKEADARLKETIGENCPLCGGIWHTQS